MGVKFWSLQFTQLNTKLINNLRAIFTKPLALFDNSVSLLQVFVLRPSGSKLYKMTPFVFYFFHVPWSRKSGCAIPYTKLVCFVDDQKTPRPLPELMFSDRGIKVDWKNWDAYIVDLVCRCAKAAKAKKYSYFSIQFYGMVHANHSFRTTCVRTFWRKIVPARVGRVG